MPAMVLLTGGFLLFMQHRTWLFQFIPWP
ncbi:MAG TPA: hypothetical protein DCQ26_00075 [Marinilabiliales bacterium]|nr:hypothetical protein [Marinilabiliales bacterium]HAZ03860.1 hypothetical protein [Marinilabiliales bacterium]HBO73521.1 hypothetical protein [Marinilabiliales bacterium]HBX86037.1 hypothetical protein [Marinilabiliales bacterium]HBY54494.1 hypothetical protein [Marinilabiliales bacterium]